MALCCFAKFITILVQTYMYNVQSGCFIAEREVMKAENLIYKVHGLSEKTL